MNDTIWFAFGTRYPIAPRPARALRVVLIAFALVVLSMPWNAPRVARATGNFVVNSSADSIATDNFLTLREAIDVANGTLTGPFSSAEQAQLGGCTFDGSGYITGGCGLGIFDKITFAPSVTQVNLTDFLPHLTDAGTWINGSAGVPRIDASGLTAGSVFNINGNSITISNLSIVNGVFSDINVESGKDARIAYNYLGTVPGAIDCSPSGVTRNAYHGVAVPPNSSGSSGANNGVAYIYGNTIGCHGQHGIFVGGADFVYIGVESDSITLTRNYIGLNSTGYNLGNGSDGIYLYASGGSDGTRWNFVKNNQIWYNRGNGIRLEGTGFNSASSTSNNWIQTNIIYANNFSGIRLALGAYTNFIGGGGSGEGNLIGWNGGDGISILNSNNNLIQGNGIGVNGTLNRGNSKTGVYLATANGNTITDNAISANAWAGVWASNSVGNTIKGNKIGTTADGTAALANGYDGIALTDGSQENTIGGTTLADRNIISGNTLCGIGLRDGANSNGIDFNLIGLNAAGTSAIPNGLAGVCIFSNSGSNTIGSSSDTAIFQYIAGNTREGVYIENSDSNTVGRSNSIGTAVDNLTPRGNGREGVLINGGRNNLVRPNLIAHNGLAGVAVVGTTATGNTIRLTEVRNNGGLPIDLGNDGHTPNGSRTPPGPNDWLNYPVITNATTNGTQVTLYGTTCANCLVLIYQAIGNPTAAGGGGTIIFSSGANSYGNWSAPLPPGIGRSDVTLQTYQSSTDNSSEMSPRSLLLLYLPLILK